ncbi:hypothetical protein [Nonomuraea sp. NPDC003709]|uniref:hypothetical protein n=1 Tax=Nonomuraea sp. NPDC003709 TaxID=3154450 RepID=UPI0033B3B1FF
MASTRSESTLVSIGSPRRRAVASGRPPPGRSRCAARSTVRARSPWRGCAACRSTPSTWLAVAQDGAKLDEEGLRLVVPGDVKGGRYVSGVVRLHVGDTDALDPA